MNRLFLAAALVFASSAARADAIRTLERGVGYAKKLSADRELNISTAKNHRITLRGDAGDHGMIAIERPSLLMSLVSHGKAGSTGRGYFLGADGKVKAEDRAELAAELKHERVSRSEAVFGLRGALASRNAQTRHAKAVDSTIDKMLAEAKPGLDKQYGKKVRITTTAAGPTIMLDEGGWGTERGVFLDADSTGRYSLAPQQRADIAKLLE